MQCVKEEDKQKMNLQGDFDSLNQSLLEIKINRCSNSTLSDQLICAPENEIDEYFEKYSFVVATLKEIIDYENFEEPMSSAL